jgi:hypothetical protein
MLFGDGGNMTDFLTRLVGRTLGSIPVVQARIPSIYEPAAVEQESVLPQLVAPASTVPTANNDIDLTAPLSSPPVEERGSISKITAIPVAKRSIDDSLGSLSSAPVAVTGEILDLTERYREQAGEEVTLSSPSSIDFETADELDGLSLPTVERQTNWHDRPQTAQKSKLETAVSGKEEIFAELSPPRFENYHDRDDLFEVKSSPPPTIRVTIGRIEVRVVSPPPPAPKPRQTAPVAKLSLSDYLGGAR